MSETPSADRDAPTTDCPVCGRSAKDCNDSHAKGWDGCCMACDEVGRLATHRLRMTPVGGVPEDRLGVRLAGMAGCTKPHRGPQGPNEDVGMCACWAPSFAMRPENEQIGLHAEDCSLPRRHPGYCEGGGRGHAPTEVVRGWWPGMDADVEAARERHKDDEETR